MKIFGMLLSFAIATVIGVVYAETSYTKVDNITMAVVTTSTTETTKEVTLSELLTEKTRKIQEINNNYSNYLSRDASLKEELSAIKTKIAEAIKLGIQETN